MINPRGTINVATGGGDGLDNPSVWQDILMGLGMLMSFIGGIWTRGATSGKTQGLADAQMLSLTERVARLEQRHDKADDRFGSMAERIAQMPTRSEMAQGFDRLENLIRERES